MSYTIRQVRMKIFNTTDQNVNVSNWSIEAGTSEFSNKGSFPVAPFYPRTGRQGLLGETASHSDPDVCFLRMGMGHPILMVFVYWLDSIVIDTVCRNPATIGDWEDDNGANPVSFAPKTSSGPVGIPNG